MRPMTGARRRRATALMVDRCTVVRMSGDVRIVAGREVRDETVVYTGRCKVQTSEGVERPQDAGGHSYIVQVYRLDLPYGSPDLLPSDLVRVVGRRIPFRVTGGIDKSHLSACRWPVEQVAA